MWLCKRDLSKECEGEYKDCTNCVLNKIRDEIEELYGKHVVRHYVFYGPSPKYIPLSEVLQIIDKYKNKTESEDEHEMS